MKSLIAGIFFLAATAFAQTSQKHPFTFEDMMALKRVGAPVPSPDGKWVVFDCEDVDLAANTKISHLWIVPASGGESKRLNPTPNHEERPRFSPDGKRLIWTSKAPDPTQIWMCDFDPEAGQLVQKPHQVTSVSTGADGEIWSPDGKNIVFVSAVYPDCKDDACNKQRDEELKKSKVKAKIFSRLFYRHWNAFTEFKRSHLFVVSADANASADATARPASDLTPGDHDVPPFHLGGQDMYAISPDGQEVAYASNIDNGQSGSGLEATSTNDEIFVVPMAGGAAKKISTSPGADTTPLYSPDGKYLAWRSQARAGFEADKWRLLVQDRQSGKTRDLTEKFDRSVGSFTWAKFRWNHDEPDFDQIFFSAEDHGEAPVFEVTPDHDEAEPPDKIAQLHADDLICVGRTFWCTRMSIQAPNEISAIRFPDQFLRGGEQVAQIETKSITHMNDALLSQIDMQPLESFTFKGANNDDVQGFMVKPRDSIRITSIP